MPELPEVEVVRSQLSKNILGKKIVSVEAEVSKLVGNNPKFAKDLVGCSIEEIERKGKLLIFMTNKLDLYILGHLRMTGQLIYRGKNRDLSGGGHTLSAGDLELPHKHTHVTISFEDGSRLYFNDMRKFGFLRLATEEEVLLEKSKYGVEPISSKYTMALFKSLFKDQTTTIKAFLLNQKNIAGLGNIYVDEVCFMSKVRPDRKVKTLKEKEKESIFHASRKVLEESIKAGGTTFNNFRNAKGELGRFLEFLQVFKREGLPCFSCGKMILKTKVAGRGTHYCPGCQK